MKPKVNFSIYLICMVDNTMLINLCLSSLFQRFWVQLLSEVYFRFYLYFLFMTYVSCIIFDLTICKGITINNTFTAVTCSTIHQTRECYSGKVETLRVLPRSLVRAVATSRARDSLETRLLQQTMGKNQTSDVPSTLTFIEGL